MMQHLRYLQNDDDDGDDNNKQQQQQQLSKPVTEVVFPEAVE